MKKTIKIAAIVLAALLALLIILPFAFRGKIDNIVKQQASTMLNASLSFDKLGINLFSHFPNASLDLKKVAIVGVDKFAGDTLVSADRITVVVNLMSIFSDAFSVRSLILDKPSLLAIQLKTGEVNWDIMKPSDTPEPEPEDSEEPSTFKLSMKDIHIKDGTITYLDSLSNMSCYTDNLTLKLSGDLSAAQSDLKIKANCQNLYYVMGSTVMLSKAELDLKMTISADLENSKFTFKDNVIRLNAIEVGLDGWVAMVDDAIDMDIKLQSPKVEFKDLLSMIPAFYTKDFKDLKASGELSLDAWAKGRYLGDNLPAFGVLLNVKNGSFKYAALPKSVDNINIKASASSTGGSADNTVLAVEKFTMTLAGNTLTATLGATTPISDMNFTATANGTVNLGQVKEVYPLGDSMSLTGIITADMSVKGRMSDVEKENYENIAASGKIAVKDMVAILKGLPQVEIAEAVATISPKALALSSLRTKIGRSDLSASGNLTNYLAYILRNDKLSGRLDVQSNLLDLNELMGDSSSSSSDSGADTTAMSVFVVPENLDLQMTANVGKIEYAKMVLDNFVGSLTIRDATVKMDRLAMNAMGGKLGASGSYSTASSTLNPHVAMALNIVGCSFEETFKQADMVKKIVPLFEKTGGDYSMTVDLNTTLGSDMSPELNTLTAKGVIQSSNINVQGIKAFEALAVALKDDRLKNIQAKDIKISFTIKDGGIETSPFDLRLGNIKLNLSGITGLDQSIDYKVKATLPVVGNMNVHIGGSFSKPKITVGVKEVVENTVKNAVNKEVEKLTGGKNVEQVINESAEKLRAQAAEKMRADAKSAGDKLIATAQREGEKLVANAKNPLAKAVAQKSADILLKTAKDQAQKMIDNAEVRIKALDKK